MIGYAVTFPFVSLCIRREHCINVINFLTFLGFLLMIFGIIQFCFRNVLPDYLLTLNEVRKFGVDNTDLLRVTGLVGTTIDYGQLCVMLAGISFSQIMIGHDEKVVYTWLKFLTACVACLLTMSRVAICGTLLIIIFIYLKTMIRIKKITTKRLIFLCVFIISLATVIYAFSMELSIILYRFSSANIISMTRNDSGHWMVINNAIQYILEYPILGYSVDTQKIEGITGFIIADGTIWEYLIQWGIFFVFLWICFTIKITLQSAKLSNLNLENTNVVAVMLGNFMFILTIDLFATSIINSVWMFRGVFIIYWLLAGIIINFRYSNIYTSRYFTGHA